MSNKSFSYYAFFGKEKLFGIMQKVNNTVDAAAEIGFDSQKKIFKNDFKGLLDFIVSLSKDNSTIIMIRFKDVFFPFLFPVLLYKRLQGVRLIIDVPTPRVILMQELKGSRAPLYFNLRRAWSLLSFSWVLFPAHKIIQYAEESTFFSFGVKHKTVKMGNGILINDKIPLVKYTWPEEELKLIGVAHIAPWHGFDRLINAIASTNKMNLPYKVSFTVVGDSGHKKNLEELVGNLGLEKQVIFTGSLTGDELDQVFIDKHIGVSSLGLYRKSLNEASDLKTREYMARGMCVLGAGQDPDFSNDSPYRFLVSNDESIESIITAICAFEDKILPSPNEVREYAENNLAFSVKIKNILSFD